MKTFALLIYNDDTLIDELPEGEFDARMRGCLDHADHLRASGRLLESRMLEGAKTAKSMRMRGGRRTVLDGPFTETKELLAGFNLVEAENMEEAVRMAEKFPWAETGCIEIREIRDMEAVRQRVGASAPAVDTAGG